MARVTVLFLGVALAACNIAPTTAQSGVCVQTGSITRLRGVPEASGVAAGRRAPGILWTHNDSGTPELFAFAPDGTLHGRVPLTGITVMDWEDVAIGPCPGGTCIYAADIGDNDHARRHITIYRFSEPRPEDEGISQAEAWQAAYPDRPHDAESLFVTPSGDVHLVTKEQGESAGLFRVPQPRGGAVVTLERVGTLPLQLATGAAVSPDGAWTAVRSNDALLVYRTKDLVGGRPQPAHRVDLIPLGEPQGEGVAFGTGGMIHLTGESGSGGTLVTLRCNLH